MSQKVFYPLTSPQLSIWYTEKMFPGTSISNVAGTLRIQANVDFHLLEKAIQLFIKNNDGIRLRLCLDENGNPQQYVSEYVEKQIPYIDFTVYNDPAKAFYEWNSEMTLKPFELMDKDLYSFTMVKISETDGGFYIITHHSVSDAWNMSLIGSFIVDYYCKLKNKITDESAYLPKPSYLSFIENDIAYKNSNRYNKDKLFWEQTFAAIPEATILKTRKTNLITAKSKRKTFVAPAKFTNKLKEYCQEHKATPYPLFLSALCMYLYRVAVKEDIVLGTPILNRLNYSDKNTSGMFISTIPLRINISAEEAFHELYERVLEVLSTSYRHQRFPYDQILRFVRDKHDIKENLYDIVLSYQNTKFDKSYEVDYITRWHFNGCQPNSLTVHINDRDDEGTIIIDYDYHEDLYYDKEIEFLHQHLLSLLWHALDNPQKAVCKIEMLPEHEKRKVLYEFNNTDMEYPREKLIHQLFEEQVEKTPDNVAIVFEEKIMTYRELNERANQLAHVLRRKGVQRDDIVGIMVPRSFELIIGILAILKAGGAFMTIEPDYPTERIRYMLENSKASILLIASNINEYDFAVKINIFDKAVYNDESKKNLEYINMSDDLVYVIYTSGTTGVPKGVMIEHKSLHNFVCSLKKEFIYNSQSTIISMASFCFDVFILEVFPTILCGSKLILINRNQQMIPCELSKLIEQNQVTTILTTPALLKLFLDNDSSKWCLSKIKYIMSGGERFEQRLLSRLRKVTRAKIVNAYGPTESTIAVTFKDITNTKKITIGKPINNTKIYILDKFKNIVPIGVQGMLYISGEGLARGYSNNACLTEQFFLQDGERADRLYSTGDIARWYPEGDIEFIGRKDKQIKLNGYRIELDEIENVLSKYVLIKDVAIMIRKTDNHGEFLCAYYVSDYNLDITSIKTYIKKYIPQYMFPKYFIKVDAIPLTANGKKDMDKLMTYDFLLNADEEIILPSNEVETKIYNILCKLLNKKEISVEADIFKTGADSLTVLQMVSLLYQEGYKITNEDVFMYPTIKQLSRIIEDNYTRESNTFSPLPYNAATRMEIEELIEAGKLSPIDSASISYIPDDIINEISKPLLIQYIKTSFGNIGFFVVPIRAVELYANRDKLLVQCLDVIYQAEKIGAKLVSLTGLIPSATGYGEDFNNRIQSSTRITTGHATTAASVILSVDKILVQCGRRIEDENIVVIGMGSIGTSVTELLLLLYPSIRKITLCELSRKKSFINDYKKKIENCYNIQVDILLTQENYLPHEIYQASLIIGATNIPNIINVNLLAPGTIIIDDSGPHCFDVRAALNRLNLHGDIMFTEGGVLKSASLMERITYLPYEIQKISKYERQFDSNNEITGCVLSGLITKKFNLSPTIGKFSCTESLKHYNILKELKFEAADPHCDNILIPSSRVRFFKNKNFTFKQYGRLSI